MKRKTKVVSGKMSTAGKVETVDTPEKIEALVEQTAAHSVLCVTPAPPQQSNGICKKKSSLSLWYYTKKILWGGFFTVLAAGSFGFLYRRFVRR